MTKKHLNPLDDPPTASSSDDDELDTSAGEEEEDEDSPSEEDKPKPHSTAVTIAVPGKSTVSAAATADSDSGSETETDSESETENPNTGSGKSNAVTVAIKNPKKKETLSSSATLALPATKKRPSEGTSKDGNSKRAKKMGENDTKKPAFQRLWSEEDEIALLQGMIDFKADTGKIPYEDTNGFYEFMKKSISVEVSKSQFMDKIRSLKKKYTGKGKNGKDVSFSKPHDVKSFGLSKFIWGPEGMGIESAKSNGISKKSQSKVKKLDSVKQELFSNGKTVEDEDVLIEAEKKTSDWFENSFLVGSIAGFGVDEGTVKQKWSEAPVESKKKIEEKMKALRVKEIDYVLQKTQFLHELASMIAEASKQ